MAGRAVAIQFHGWAGVCDRGRQLFSLAIYERLVARHDDERGGHGDARRRMPGVGRDFPDEFLGLELDFAGKFLARPSAATNSLRAAGDLGRPAGDRANGDRLEIDPSGDTGGHQNENACFARAGKARVEAGLYPGA